jgi:hypothetical protein
MSLPAISAYNVNVVSNYQQAEYGKFLQLIDSTSFPAVSVTRIEHPDTTQAFPQNTNAPSLTTIDVYPKYATLNYVVNATDFPSPTINLSAGTVNISTSALTNYAADIDSQIINVINPAVAATAWNTYDTLTAVIAFNNNYLATVSGLSAKITNPITISNTVAISSSSVLPISGNVNILNPVTTLSATILNTISSFNIAGSNITLSVSGSITNTVAISTTQTLPVSVINSQIEVSNDIGNPVPINTTQTLPISGTVTVTNTVTSTVINTVSSQIVNTNASPVLVKQADTLQIDPLGRLRTAMNNSSWWYQAAVDKDGDLRYTEQFVGLSAQSQFIAGIGNVTMTPGLSSTGSAIRQTRRYFKYRQGVGHQIFFTMNWSGYQTGVVKRMGQFDASDGMFFELSGSNFNVVVRRSLPDGTIIEERTNSTNFTNDKLDGTGPTQINMFSPAVTAANLSAVSITQVQANANYAPVWNVVYDTNNVDLTSLYKVGTKITIGGDTNYNGIVFLAGISTTALTATYTYYPSGALPTGRIITASQTPWNMEWTYWMDYIGGRTSRIRFVIASPNQGAVLLHTYSTGGTLGTQFISEPCSPLRYEIFNTQTQTSLPFLTLASESVEVEAEVALNPGFGTAINTDGKAYQKTTGNEYPIIGVSLRPGEPYNRGDLQIQDIQIAETGNNGNYQPTPTYYWRLVLNPTITGATTITNIGKASQQIIYAATANQVTGGITLYSGFFVGGGSSINVQTALNFLNLGTNVNLTTPDTVVLCAQLITAGQNNSTLYGGFNFIEAL